MGRTQGNTKPKKYQSQARLSQAKTLLNVVMSESQSFAWQWFGLVLN